MGTRRTRRFWLCWALALAVTAVWTISASPVQTSQPVGGAAHGSYVALTFDDGPWPGTTNALLDGLAQRGHMYIISIYFDFIHKIHTCN